MSDARFDTVLSIGLGGIISMAILICAAANIYGTDTVVTNGKDMALDRERTQRLTYDLGQTLDIPVVSGSDTHQPCSTAALPPALKEPLIRWRRCTRRCWQAGMRSSWSTAQPFRCALPACSNALSRKFTPWAATMWQY